MKKPWFTDAFRGHRKRPVVWNGVTFLDSSHLIDFTHHLKRLIRFSPKHQNAMNEKSNIRFLQVFSPKNARNPKAHTTVESINISTVSKSTKSTKEKQDAKIIIWIVKDQLSTNCELLKKQIQLQKQVVAGNMTEKLIYMSNKMLLQNTHVKRIIFKYCR